MKRLFVALLVLVFVGAPLALGTALFLALHESPAVQRSAQFTPADIERAKRILQQNDPRLAPGETAPAGGLRTLVLPASDVDLVVNYLLNRLDLGSSRIALEAGRIRIEATIRLPENPLARVANLRAVLRESTALPEIESLKLGRLPLPRWLAELAFTRAQEAMNESEEYRLAVDAIRSVAITPQALRITWAWNDELSERLRALTLGTAERERLRAYHEQLARLSTTLPPTASLARLLPPLMDLASERSTRGDAIAEQRALIAVLAFYVNGRHWSELVPEARHWRQAVPRQLTLRGRHDLAQHFSVSALIAAFAGSPLADAVGLHKELEDAHVGSGFSFPDLAADRAGTVFGQRATGPNALELARRVAAGIGEDDLVPEVADLPEFMNEVEFRRRFGGVGAPRYEEMRREIEQRIAACALYRE